MSSGTEAVAMTQWQGQQHPLCLMESAVVAEPYPAELKLQMGPAGAILAEVVKEETPEHTITGEVVIVSLLGHTEILQKKVSM